MRDIARLLRDVTDRGDELRRERGAAAEARRRLFDDEELVLPRVRLLPKVAWLAAAAALVALLVWFVVPRTESLSFAVAGRAGTTMTWIDVSIGVTPIRFSDGTQILLHPGARARVDAATERGADISLEAGRAVVSVVPKKDAHWVFHAGDYDVRVTGTVFELTWSGDDKSLLVQMHEGSVVVTGPDLPEPRVLTAGQSVLLGKGSDASVDAAPPATNAAQAPTASAAALVDAATSPAPGGPTPVSPAAPSAEPPPRWRDVASRGDHKAAYALLDPIFASELASADAAGLLEIARVCRLGGNAERANAAYLAVRSKHPGTAEASQAAFALGGLRFSSDPSAARTWFRTFLAESPSHALASAARGRVLELAVSAKSADAREVAAEYLANHPDGAHAELARTTLAPKSD